VKPCTDHTPPWFVGNWHDWHRGHGCDQDDGKPRSEDAKTEVAQHAANARTGYLTDAELGFLRASTTSGDTLRVRALDELAARRVARIAQHALTDDELNVLRAATPTVDTLRVRALDELTERRAARIQVLKAVAICPIGKEVPRTTTDPARFCTTLDEWAGLMIKAKIDRGVDESRQFEQSWREVRMAITKSCLLDRVLYHHEQPSQTPCPVHKGIWAGCHVGWPGQLWSDGKPVEIDTMLQEWHDAGCRCHLHSCGCTTGWNPDEHCGCGERP